jgi:TPP-dependent pyruvate/acetoin dehydrogenase alpha subunit
MKRSRFDPPEYRSWQPDPEPVAAFEAGGRGTPAHREHIASLEPEVLARLYFGMVRFRLFDTMLKRWVRQGVISKAWLATGEEAVSIGCAQALQAGDVLGPMIRNAGACFEMGMPLVDHFAGYLGTNESPASGRDLHVGDLAHGVVAPISHVGSQLPVMCGLALAYQLKREPRVALTWVGDGASRTGEVHEALNFAAVRRLPLVVVLQNNQVALGTRTHAQTAADYEDWMRGYGIEVRTVDGNNILDVHQAAVEAVGACRSGGGPRGLVAHTFRMGGHATHDEAEARRLFTSDEFASWGQRDPIGNFEAWLTATGRLGGDRPAQPEATRRRLEELEARAAEEVEAAAQRALAGRSRAAVDPARVADGVYADRQTGEGA